MSKSQLLRLDNVGIVVDDLKAMTAFFTELGLELEAEMPVAGDWVDNTVGLKGVQNDIAMLRTPNNGSKIELMKFRNPAPTASAQNLPVNALGIRRMMFAVTNIDDVVERLKKHKANLLGDIAQFVDLNNNGYRLGYVRSPEGIIVGLAQQVGGDVAQASGRSSLLRMDNVLIVINDVDAARKFFEQLGFEFEGETTVEGDAVSNLLGLKNVRATLVVLKTPDGRMRIELDKFHSPAAVGEGNMNSPVNTIGMQRIMCAVTDIRDTVDRLQKLGATLIGEITNYENVYLLCYMRGPEGIVVALAEKIG